MRDIIPFASASLFRKWLTKNYAKSAGIWLRIYKRDSGVKTVTYQEAVEEVLCFGWIDGQADSYDADSYLVKVTPRRPKSLWSKRNKKIVAMLIRETRMRPPGSKEITAAKKDGRWEKAYDSPKDMKVPADFLRELKKFKKAYAFFLTLNKSNTYAIGWRLQTAKKEETRTRRMKAIIAMLKKGQKLL